jgi:hypothetical protein
MTDAASLPAVRPIATAADLTAVRALFREYAASLDTDLCFQDFDAEVNGLEPPAVGEIKRLYVRLAGRGQRLGFREITAYRHNPVPGTLVMELDLTLGPVP